MPAWDSFILKQPLITNGGSDGCGGLTHTLILQEFDGSIKYFSPAELICHVIGCSLGSIWH